MTGVFNRKHDRSLRRTTLVLKSTIEAKETQEEVENEEELEDEESENDSLWLLVKLQPEKEHAKWDKKEESLESINENNKKSKENCIISAIIIYLNNLNIGQKPQLKKKH